MLQAFFVEQKQIFCDRKFSRMEKQVETSGAKTK